MNKDFVLMNRRSKIILFLSVFVCIYWSIGNLMDIYQFAIVGAIFEILWLPMLSSLFIIPALSIGFLIRDKFKTKWVYLASILIISVTVLVMFAVHSN